MLLVHSATFALYMVSIIVYYVFYTLHYVNYSDAETANNFLLSGIFSQACNFLAQVCLCVIFWQFASKQKAPVAEPESAKEPPTALVKE